MTDFRLRIAALLMGMILVACAPLGCGAGGPGVRNDLVVGVKIYDCRGDMPALFSSFADLGINTLFASEALATSREFRDLARRHSMPVFVILPVFYDPEALEKDPSLAAITRTGGRAEDDWVRFVCPSRAEFRRKKVEAIVRTVASLQPEGVSIDFIRFFVFWEMVGPERSAASLPNTCFCPRCLVSFSSASGVSVPATAASPQQAAAWIEANHLRAWTAWKCGLITSMADEIVRAVRGVRPGVKVNLHAVPWRRGDYAGAIRTVAGQDIAALSQLTDYLSPMCYASMLHRSPEWIASVVEDLAAHASCPILPSIQVKPDYPGDLPVSTAEFEAYLDAALAPPSRGVVLWNWDQLASEPDKMAALRRRHLTHLKR